MQESWVWVRVWELCQGPGFSFRARSSYWARLGSRCAGRLWQGSGPRSHQVHQCRNSVRGQGWGQGSGPGEVVVLGRWGAGIRPDCATDCLGAGLRAECGTSSPLAPRG